MRLIKFLKTNLSSLDDEFSEHSLVLRWDDEFDSDDDADDDDDARMDDDDDAVQEELPEDDAVQEVAVR